MKKYGVRVLVHFSAFAEIEANSKEEAEKIVKEQYYNGDIMPKMDNNEYYDGMEIDIEYP